MDVCDRGRVKIWSRTVHKYVCLSLYSDVRVYACAPVCCVEKSRTESEELFESTKKVCVSVHF